MFFRNNNNWRQAKTIIFVGKMNIDLLDNLGVLDDYKILKTNNGFFCLIDMLPRITGQSQTTMCSQK